MDFDKIILSEKYKAIEGYWDPKNIGTLNGQAVKIAKVKGDFIMHHHENEDELFLVIKGKLFIEFKDKTINLLPGEMIIVPKGIKHRPYTEIETHILLFEPLSTINTGNINNDMTKKKIDHI